MSQLIGNLDPESLKALVGASGADDGRLAALLQLINGAAEEQTSDDTESQHLVDEVKLLRRENRRLRQLNDALLAHSEFMAAGIGACPLCWGEDPQCEECHGEGGPGSFLPDRDCFDEFVRPAIETLRNYVAERRKQAASPDENRPVHSDDSTPGDHHQMEE